MVYQALNNEGFSLYHERLYTLRVDGGKRRKGMNKEREGENGYRRRVSPIRDVQALGVFKREF